MITTRNYDSAGIAIGRFIRATALGVFFSLMLVHTGSQAAPSKSKKVHHHNSSKSASKDEQKFKAMVHRVAKDVGVDPALLMAVVKVESNFDQHATNPSGPMGLMQITHTTAKTVSPKISRRDLMLPEKNLRVGAQHLKQLLQDFQDPKLALAAYQAGAGRVKEKGHHILGNPHTADHVDKVMQQYQTYREHKDYGYKPVSYKSVSYKPANVKARKVALTQRK